MSAAASLPPKRAKQRDATDDAEAVATATALLRRRLCGKDPPAFTTGLSEARDNLATLLTSSVNRGEGNSVLLVGPRGSGKSLVVRQALERVSRE